MKKNNVILQAAIASALFTMMGSAYAASSISATSIAYAKEQFAGTTPYAAAVGPTMSVLSATSIPAGSIITVQVELTGGVFAADQVGDTTANTAANIVDATTAMPLAAPTCTMGSTIAGVTAAATGVVAQTATAANANVVSCSFTTVNAVGIGGTVLRIATPSINAAGLASTSATVTATASILVGSVAAPVGTAVSTTGTLEAASPAKTIATSAQGVTLAAAAGTAGQIDLTASPVASAFTGAVSATIVNLGTITATNGSTKKVSDGTTAYTIASQNKMLTATVTAPAGFFAALKTTGTIHLDTGANCATATLAGATSATFATNAAAAAATSVSVTSTANPASATAYNVCMTIPASGTTSVALIEGTPTVTATLGAAAAQDSTETLASTNLWALAYNGQTVTVRNYVPLAATGYYTFVRVINTGAVSAPVSVALKDDTTGVTGTSGVLATLAAGAARNFTPTEIEAVTGAVASTARPRLVITAPTNALDVQTFLFDAAGNFADMTGAQ